MTPDVNTQVLTVLRRLMVNQLIYAIIPQYCEDDDEVADDRADKINAMMDSRISGKVLDHVTELFTACHSSTNERLLVLAAKVGVENLFNDGWIDLVSDYLYEHRKEYESIHAIVDGYLT